MPTSIFQRAGLSSCPSTGFLLLNRQGATGKTQKGSKLTRPELAFEEFGIVVGISRGTTTQDFQCRRAGIIHAMRCPRRHADRITRIDGEYLIAQHHPALTCGDVIKLLGAMMLVQMRSLPYRYHRLRQTLVRIPVHTRVHQLADVGTVFGDEGLNAGVTGLVQRKPLIINVGWVERSETRRTIRCCCIQLDPAYTKDIFRDSHKLPVHNRSNITQKLRQRSSIKPYSPG